MPAKAKYLSSGWTRFSKVLAAILGAYLATMFLHVAIAKSVENDTPVLLTSTFSAFLMWVGFMTMVFLIKKAWVSWAIFAGICAVGALFIFL